MVLVMQASADRGEKLLSGLWPDAPFVSDPELRLYTAFGLGRGSLGEVMGPATWLAGLRALRKGHFVGRPVGDPLVLPGLFLVHGDRVLWRHAFAHSGDQPSEEELLAGVRTALASAP